MQFINSKKVSIIRSKCKDTYLIFVESISRSKWLLEGGFIAEYNVNLKLTSSKKAGGNSLCIILH